MGSGQVSGRPRLTSDAHWWLQIIDKLSVHAPSGEAKLKLLVEIAEEGGLEWDSSATEEVLLRKPKLDLLDAPQPYWQAEETPFDGAGPSAPPKTNWVDPEMVEEELPAGEGAEDTGMAEYQRKREKEREARKALIRTIADEATARGQKAMEAVRSATQLTRGEEEEGGRANGQAGGVQGSKWDGEERGGGAAATGTNFDDFVAHSSAKGEYGQGQRGGFGGNDAWVEG